MSEHCVGYPDGAECLSAVREGWLFCDPCRRARQQDAAAALIGDFLPVGVLLQDIDIPQPVCQCGGDALAPGHAMSLLHRRWLWLQGPGGPPPRAFTTGTG